MNRLGLLGGTFDPPHLGHLVAAQECAEQLQLERVLFLPAGEPPHKQGEQVSPAEDRLKMVELAIQQNPCFRLSRADSVPGPSYSADLLAEIRAEAGPETELFFLVGMDSLRDLTTWKDPERILAQCVLVAVQRPGSPAVDPIELGRDIPGGSERILILKTPGLDVSSRDLRARVASGRSIRYMVPEAVRHYIQQHGLYVKPGALSERNF